MCCYKKKKSMGLGKLMLLIFAALGAMAAAFAAFKFVKKHFFCRCKDKKGGMDLSDFDLGLTDKDVPCGCCSVVADDNDMRSEDNAVVNSENRMLNIENED